MGIGVAAVVIPLVAVGGGGGDDKGNNLTQATFAHSLLMLSVWLCLSCKNKLQTSNNFWSFSNLQYEFSTLLYLLLCCFFIIIVITLMWGRRTFLAQAEVLKQIRYEPNSTYIPSFAL